MHSNYDNVDLEEMYQDAMLATTMFDAPILEQTLTALHDALSRKQAEVERLERELKLAEEIRLKLLDKNIKIQVALGEPNVN